MRKCTSVQYSQILNKNLLLAFLDQKSFWRSMWRIMPYNFLFSSYFDHSVQRQLKTAEHPILYTICNMKNASKHF